VCFVQIEAEDAVKMMKTIKKTFVVCVVICVIFLLLSTGFPQIPVVFAVTSVDSVVAYGAEAQTFVSMLSAEFPDLNFVLMNQSRAIVVISDISVVNLQSVSDSMKKGAIIVAINLPEDNGLVDVPRHSFGSKRTIGCLMISETWQENVIPPYWIMVTKQTTPSFTGQFIGGTADDEQSHEHVMQMALEGVYSALFPDSAYHYSSPETVVDGDHWNVDSENTVVWPILGIAIVAGGVLIVVMLVVVGGVVLLMRKGPKV
jgi:hypothetical protein